MELLREGQTTAVKSQTAGETALVPRLRIAITVDPEIPVPPKFYGGIERIVDLLVRGLAGRGHAVMLFAHPASDVPCDLRPYPGLRSGSVVDTLRNAWFTSSRILPYRPDVVHSFGRLAYLLPILPTEIPKVMSYQRVITERRVDWAERVARQGTLSFTGCSAHLIRKFAGRKNWRVVYNAVPAGAYRLNATVADHAPLVFLGRMEEIKGPHLAIEVARRSGRRLILAGNIPEGHESFFAEKVEPFIDGHRIRYAGPVDDQGKNELLGEAAALLMPILWDEPFGIVMAEALACGTPVIGLRRGSVPEVVQHGINGFICESVEEMAAAVEQLSGIDRRACRRIMEEHFSDQALVKAFEQLYREVVLDR
jgi:glycosyltransferase involved in cell wall biosynthesis